MNAGTADSHETRIQALLADLIRERQRLEGTTDLRLLEANRLSIVYWQRRLSRHREQ